MAAKLEWVYKTRGFWSAGCREIWVDADGRFYTDDTVILGGHGLLDEAKAYCQEQEDAVAPAELPAVGSVWGDAKHPGTWRWVVGFAPDSIQFRCLSEGGRYTHPIEKWHSWVRDTGAVRIDGEGARVKELERFSAELINERDELRQEAMRIDAEIRLLRNGARGNWWAWQGSGDNLESLTCPVLIRASDLRAIIGERDDTRTRVAALEAENAKLRERIEMSGRVNFDLRHTLETDAVATKAMEQERDDLRTALAALEKQYQACEDKVATEFERCGRLMEALRGIEGHDSDVCDHEDYGGCWKWVRRLAREAIAKEEGGRG